MGVILLDTSVLIDHLRGHALAVAALDEAAGRGHRLIASVMTRVEVLAGMRPAEERATRRLLDILDWIVIDEEIAENAGRLGNHFLRSHGDIDPVDYVIAATADRADAILWTRNLKHFPMFPDLKAPY